MPRHFLIQWKWPFAAVICALGSGSLAGLVSLYGVGFFNGPDGVLWVVPWLLWMGALGVITALLQPYWERKGLSGSARILLFVVILLAGSITFISLQRLSSGVRVFESYNVIMCQRVAEGISLYGDPQMVPIGTIYTPLYFLLGGLFHLVLPEPFAWERLISLVAALASAWGALCITRRLGGSVEQGLWAAVLFLATYAIMGCRYDETSPNPLLMCLTVFAVLLFLKRSPVADGWALFVAGLACFAKQPGLLPFMAVLVFVLTNKKPSWARLWPLPFWLATGMALVWITHGQAWEYLVTFPGKHGMRALPEGYCMQRLLLMQAPLWVAFVWAMIRKPDRRFIAFFIAVLIASILGIWKSGGWLNALFPVEPLLCAGAALCAVRPLRVLGAAQLLLGFYNPLTPLYPWATIRDTDRLAVRTATATPGEVWFPSESYLSRFAEKKEWDHFGALESYCWAGKRADRLIAALDKEQIGAIILRAEAITVFEALPQEIIMTVQEHYHREEIRNLVIYRARGK